MTHSEKLYEESTRLDGALIEFMHRHPADAGSWMFAFMTRGVIAALAYDKEQFTRERFMEMAGDLYDDQLSRPEPS